MHAEMLSTFGRILIQCKQRVFRRDFLLFLALALTIHTDFEGGNLGPVEPVSPLHFRLHVNGQTDQQGRNRQASWYYFRVDNAARKTITFELVDLAGEYNFAPTRGAITKDTPPYISYDQKSWQPVATFQFESAGPTLRFSVQPKRGRFWIAHFPPYTNQHYNRMLQQLRNNRHLRIESIGTTPEGRPMHLLTITDSHVPDKGKKVLWLMFRQHAWESGSSWTGEGALRFALSAAPTAVQIRRTTILKILPLCDPDGVAGGRVRFNAQGYDLNRNWDVVMPERLPEITLQRKAILAWVDSGQRIDAFVSLHNTETAEYVAGAPDANTQAAVALFGQLWSEGQTFSPSEPPRTFPSKVEMGRRNVGQGLFDARKVPTMEVEMRIAHHPKLRRRPNIADRLLSGQEMLTALWKTISTTGTEGKNP